MKMFLPQEFKLPAMPQVARECLVYLYNPNADSAILAKSLSRDIAISASILQLANSSLFLLGKGSPTSDLKTAIFRIGHDNLRQIMVLHALESTFVFKDSLSFEFNSFIRHCSFVSLLCANFAKKIAPDFVSEVQMAGLMHDVGLAITASLFNENFTQMAKHCLENAIDFASTENQLGLEPHSKLAFRALTTWEIPEKVKILISYHDTKNMELRKDLGNEMNKLIDILVLSDVLAHSYGFGFKDYKRDTKIELSMLKRMELSADIVKEVVKNSLETESAIQPS